MTEDEAKKKWCPYVQQWAKAGAVDVAMNRPSAAATVTMNCIASDCAAWRWLPFMAGDSAYIAAIKMCENERKMKRALSARYVNQHRAEFGLPPEPFDGYCGLAGKPEVTK